MVDKWRRDSLRLAGAATDPEFPRSVARARKEAVSATACLSLQDLLASLQGREPAPVSAVSAVMADRRITVECDDSDFFPEFFTFFGGPAPVPGRIAIPTDIHLDVRAHLHPEFGWFRMSGSNDLPNDAHEFSFTVEEALGTFERLHVDEAGWKCVAFRGSGVPAFAFRDRDCLFSLGARWQGTIVRYLFWRLLRIRSDAIFFHASALGIDGEGTVFVGPKGSGKSTLSLALAARGHNFLADDVAGYIPERGELIPFRRPVGIKPGPRARAVERGLAPGAARQIARDGYARVDIATLFTVQPPRPFPLRRVVFLSGFAENPLLERVTPRREEIIRLQPLMSSFLNASHSKRVFELARLLSSAKVYRLHPGDPDATAAYVEERFARE